jgi:Glycosyltransferase family 9 (heptosyltransferase)
LTVATEGETLPPFDCYCPQLSLPHIFKTTLETVPAPIPYLFSDPAKAQYWHEKLGEKTKPRIGLVWSGGFHVHRPETWAWNKRRNLNLDHLKYFRDLPFEFYSLQKGDPAESELRNAQQSGWDGPAIINFTDELKDFSDTAALIEQLDLVISVDTSTAHLAGAMGKPVWLLNRFDCCWRWLEQNSRSPWYPNMTIFNQPRPGDWDNVLNQMVQALDDLHANASMTQEKQLIGEN